ncbi:MAG: CPBP family glutamic-type intramembrane protease [Myxococcota bacterium]|nr:CPBP family glutamic-type intramembrane protease [Myxococcota bacterium]
MNRIHRAAAHPDDRLTAKPGAWGELALTLPVFLTYQLGVVFLHVRNASDLLSGRLLELAHGDRLTYLALTAVLATAMVGVFALLGRGHALRPRKLVQIALEGSAYAISMGAASSWLVGKLFARVSPAAAEGPFAGLIMSLGAGFYEEIAFRVALFGLGAKLLVWLIARQRIALVGSSPVPRPRALFVMAAWALVCAFAFSLVHYLGPLGDAFDARSFVARVVLGLALTLVYGARGFAAAVWTHALYDIWVLVL